MPPTEAPVSARRPTLSVWYLAWDGVIVALAIVAVLGMLLSADQGPRFWTSFGGGLATSLLLAVALAMSVRVRAPNLAVATIALLGPVIASRLAGDDGASTFVIVVVSLMVGLVVGMVLVGLIVALRLPAWASTLGVSGLLAALSIQFSDSGRRLDVSSDSWIANNGVLLMLAAATLGVAVGVASLFAPIEERTSEPRSGALLAAQAGSLVASSAIAGLAGALFAVQTGFVDGRLGQDLSRPLAIVLLAAISLRGRHSGVVAVVAAAFVVEAVSRWWIQWGVFERDMDPNTSLVIVAVLSIVGLVVGAVLELLSNRGGGGVDEHVETAHH